MFIECPSCFKKFDTKTSRLLNICDACWPVSQYYNEDLSELLEDADEELLTEEEYVDEKCCSFDGCDTKFLPTNNRQRFCKVHGSAAQAPSVETPVEAPAPAIPETPAVPAPVEKRWLDMVNVSPDEITEITISLKNGITILIRGPECDK